MIILSKASCVISTYGHEDNGEFQRIHFFEYNFILNGSYMKEEHRLCLTDLYNSKGKVSLFSAVFIL